MKTKILALILPFVMLFGVAAPAQAIIIPKKSPGVTITTDGMPTRLTFVTNKNHTKVVCVDIRTAPGKDRVIKFLSSGTHIKTIRVKGDHNTPGTCETSFPVTARRLTVKVQEQILLKKWLGKGTATLYLW
jgi:hypothetical protein